MSCDAQVRNAAEQRLKALEVTDDFSRHLSDITVDTTSSIDPSLRQLASVMLRQYVDTHWSPSGEKFLPPEPSEETKAYLRQVLPAGLHDSNARLRSAVAFSLSAIAHWEWPEQWPQLLDILLACLRSGPRHAVHGAMRVLIEFTRDLTDTHAPTVAPALLDECYRIFVDVDNYSIRTRSRAVEIFHTCTSLIATIAEHDRQLAKSLLMPVLPRFTEALVASLKIPYGSSSSDCGLRMEVLKSLTMLVTRVPKHTALWLPDILPPVWDTLTSSAQLYVRSYVNDLEDHDDPYDSDGQVLSFDNLVYSIFEFVGTLIDNKKFCDSVKNGLDDLVYYIIVYGQVTEEQINTWTQDSNRFAEDEAEETFSHSVRVESRELLMKLCEEFEEPCVRAVCSAITRHVQESALSRERHDRHWWKIHESCMQAIVIVSGPLLEFLNSGKMQFDLMSFIEKVVVADLKLEDASPFLLGQCLVTGSKFGQVMTSPQSQSFLQATVNGVGSGQPAVLRTASLRAIIGFCEAVNEKDGGCEVLVPFLAPIVDRLIPFVAEYQGGEVLSLMLKAIRSVVPIHEEFTFSYEAKISPLAIAIFLKYNSDPVLISLSQDIFCELSKNGRCLPELQRRLVPTLVSILNQQSRKLPTGMQAVALDVLQTLVRSSTAPVSDLLLSHAFPAAVHCVLGTDDNSVMQSGGECLRAYISVASEQILQFRDPQSRSGLAYLVQVCTHLLSPAASEFSAAFVGRLLMVLVTRVGDRLGNELETLLRATLSKMVNCQTTTVLQSLVMVYAHLLNSQLESVLAFLCSVPGPSGQSALHFLLTEWCDKQRLFYGKYEVKVSVVAMCRLLQHGVNTQDSRLNDITVEGDEVYSTQGIRTRSQRNSQPSTWTKVPVLVKIFKLLLNELSMAIEQDENQEEGDDDDDEDEEENGYANKAGDQVEIPDGVPLSDLLAEELRDEDVADEEEEDPDALADPVYHINLRQHLTAFISAFCQQSCFSLFMPHLLPTEMQLLSKLSASCST